MPSVGNNNTHEGRQALVSGMSPHALLGKEMVQLEVWRHF